jgi:ubiquinone/menaquinone biosynthesis C-methylase UbiE
MDHADHVRLIMDGITHPGGVWADLGSGRGAFTLALADLIGSTGVIHSVDRDGSALRKQQQAMQARFPNVLVHYHRADFTQRLELPPLAGIVMANSLHFVRNKEPLVSLVRGYLQPGGRLIVVEYNTPRGNCWVPYPLTFDRWVQLAEQCGFASTRLLATRPSSFLGEFFSAVSIA